MINPSTGSLQTLKRYLSEKGGVLYWNVLSGDLSRTEKRHNTMFSGKSAGSDNGFGYLYVSVLGVQYPAHKIVWYLRTGRWPKLLDHRNGIRSDNDFPNLREATHSENSCNTGVSTRNTSGVKGVSWNEAKGKWKVRVTKAGCCHFGGWFDDFDTAAGVAAGIRRALHGEFAK